MVHVTGGGFPENLPRMLPPQTACQIERSTWRIPEIFKWIQEVNPVLLFFSCRCQVGSIDEAEMFRTFNMGIGMVIAVDKGDVSLVTSLNPQAIVMGQIVADDSEQGVVFV